MDSIKNSKSYFETLTRAMAGVVPHIVDQVAMELLDAYWSDRTVFIFGNGGSATTASHFACDLGKGASQFMERGAKRFRVIALNDNMALMTAWANDFGYENVFAEQLRNLVRVGDVVIAISGSGNSPNVLKALETARNAKATTIGLTGFMGGKMKPLCRRCVVIPSDNMEVIEDLHLAICHSLSTVVRAALADVSRANIAAVSRSAVRLPSILCSDFGTNRTSLPDDTIADLQFSQMPPIGQKGEPVQDHLDGD